MNEINLKVTVDLTIKDNRSYINILIPPDSNLSRREIASILTGGLSLIIRSNGDPKSQGEMLSEVVKHLESELVNVDSFSDAYYYKKDV